MAVCRTRSISHLAEPERGGRLAWRRVRRSIARTRASSSSVLNGFTR